MNRAVVCVALSSDAHKQQQSSHMVLIKAGLYFYLPAGLSRILSEADFEPSIWVKWFTKETLPGETSEELWEADGKGKEPRKGAVSGEAGPVSAW